VFGYFFYYYIVNKFPWVGMPICWLESTRLAVLWAGMLANGESETNVLEWSGVIGAQVGVEEARVNWGKAYYGINGTIFVNNCLCNDIKDVATCSSYW